MPVNQLVMMKLLVNQALLRAGPAGHAGRWARFFDGIARHTPEGYAFQQQAMREGFKSAVRARDQPFE